MGDFEREYMNEIPKLGGEYYCPRCERVTPSHVESFYEITREPNKSHPEWFHHTQVGYMHIITPRNEFVDRAVITRFTRCDYCKRTVAIEGRPIHEGGSNV